MGPCPEVVKVISWPALTIIIPVKNNSQGLTLCLEAISKQNYPAEFISTIVVDDHSNPSVKDQFPTVPPNTTIVLSTGNGPGSARNQAIELANTEILVFTDSDCIPNHNWIQEGVLALQEHPNTGIVGGEIHKFSRIPDKPNCIELYSSIFDWDQRSFVNRLHFAATANLFTYKRIFETVGPFNENYLLAGEDLEWGQRVFRAGFSIHHAPASIVKHPAHASLPAYIQKKHIQLLSGAHARDIHRGLSLKSFFLIISNIAKEISQRILVSKTFLDQTNNRLFMKFRLYSLIGFMTFLENWIRLRIQFSRRPRIWNGSTVLLNNPGSAL